MGFADKNPPSTFLMSDATVSSVLFVNRSVVKKTDFNSLKDLLDSRWKGKIVMDDPRREGSGVNALSILAANYGKDFVRQLLTQQEVVFSRNRRQIAEWLLRGRYPLAMAVSSQEVADFRKRGIGKHVERFKAKFPVADTYSPGFGGVALFSKAPHSNAAKVYLNWLLSKKGQQAWAQVTLVGSGYSHGDGIPVVYARYPSSSAPLWNHEHPGGVIPVRHDGRWNPNHQKQSASTWAGA